MVPPVKMKWMVVEGVFGDCGDMGIVYVESWFGFSRSRHKLYLLAWSLTNSRRAAGDWG